MVAIYNASAKRYYGGNDDRDLFDGTDILRQKRDTALPNTRTRNLDAIKLIGALKAVVEHLWSFTYQVDFYQENLSPTMPRKVWHWPDGAGEPELLDLVMDALLVPPVNNGDGTWREYAMKVQLAPSITGKMEIDFPVDTNFKTDDQVRAERYKKFQSKCNGFWNNLQQEQIRLQNELNSIQITLHAHSQGAIVAAVAQTRLGSVPRTRVMTAAEMDTETPPTVKVAPQIRLVSYGGGANMHDWGSALHYKSYAHHVNAYDAIAYIVGMHDPFQDVLRNAAPVLQLIAIGTGKPLVTSFVIKRYAKGSCITELMNDPFNPHIAKVISVPAQADVAQWASGSHVVVYHDSKAALINDKEHNFVNGYKCSVGTEFNVAQYPKRFLANPLDPTWIRWFWQVINPNVVTGEMGCLYR